jgi:hypothetical protein
VAVSVGGAIAGGYGADADKPTGLTDGDLWVIWVGGFYDATTTPATASGFTVISGAGFAGHATGDRLSGTWLAKIVTNAAGEPSSVPITPGGSVGDMKPVSFYVRGASNVSVADAVAGVSSANTNSGTSLTLPSVSVTRNGSLAAIGECAWDFDQWHAGGEPANFDAFVSYSGNEVHALRGTTNVDAGGSYAPTVQFTDASQNPPATRDGLVAMVVFQPAAEGRDPLFFGTPSLLV